MVDSSGRGVPLVEAIVASIPARTITDSTGRFRFVRVPVGEQRILLRAIGYEPRPILALVRADSVTDLGRLVLSRRIVELPTLEVAGTLPRPVFRPGSYVALGGSGGTRIQYAWFGASMTEDGVYLIPGTWRQRGARQSIHYHIQFTPEVSIGTGVACGTERIARVVATRVNGDEITLFAEDGVVWKAAVLADRIGGCETFTRFPFQSPIKTAAAVDSGWVVVLERLDGMVLAAINEVGRPRWVKSLAEVLQLSRPPTDTVTVTSTRSGAIVALLSSPFEWVELSHAGTVLLRGSPRRGSAVGDSLRARIGPRWKAFGVLPIPNGYVQSIETDRRDTGWHLVYDVLGRPARLAPRGHISVMVASEPERRRIFGFSHRPTTTTGGRLIVQRY